MVKQYINSTFFFFMLQYVQFTRSYNITPSVLISANHSTTASGNLAPAQNGITTWIEVKHYAIICDTVDGAIFTFLRFFPLCKKWIVTLLPFGVAYWLRRQIKISLSFFIYFPFLVYQML